MKIKFDVTQEDIDKGCRMDASGCMVSRCMQRTLIWNKITTSPENSTIYLKNSICDYELSSKTIAKILSFDEGKKVKPFYFSLNIPDSVLEQIGYFEKKGDKYVESFVSITAKENNNEESSKRQRRTTVLEKETDRKNPIHA